MVAVEFDGVPGAGTGVGVAGAAVAASGERNQKFRWLGVFRKLEWLVRKLI